MVDTDTYFVDRTGPLDAGRVALIPGDGRAGESLLDRTYRQRLGDPNISGSEDVLVGDI